MAKKIDRDDEDLPSVQGYNGTKGSQWPYQRDAHKAGYRRSVDYNDDPYVPEGRRHPTALQNRQEEGFAYTQADIQRFKEEGEICNLSMSDKKCIKQLRKDYARKHKIVTTSECNGIMNPFKKRRCLKKYNRGL